MDAPRPLAALERRFRALWRRCVGPDADPAAADAAWETLARGYTEPHRRYHNLDHLDHCLHGLDLAATVAKDPKSLELAIWFHDVVNEPGSGDNEQRSAEVFEGLLGPHLLPQEVRHIRRLIMTTTHRARPEGGDERFIADIDLSSLASPWPRFLVDSENLRAEEPERSDADYYGAKVRFHRGLLKRARLFNTAPFQLRYESQGRENLERFLALLAERGYT
jgi:predicted metal-dependent HD superfamily phosphohydrolase